MHHDNGRPQTADHVIEFLPKNKVMITKHPPYPCMSVTQTQGGAPRSKIQLQPRDSQSHAGIFQVARNTFSKSEFRNKTDASIRTGEVL